MKKIKGSDISFEMDSRLISYVMGWLVLNVDC